MCEETITSDLVIIFISLFFFEDLP
ncbi:uncharacterized protein METZ01_LOCUS17752 [marine metagenome]|uniref:Uncharacterized protein n=1 Tax=marine metagenome TaxID=408172 RepID=A0A381PEX2_9ZZZZ